jgi:transcriptional regulator
MSMYRPKAFIEDDRSELVRFMRANPLATLVTFGGEILTTHVPVLVTEGDDAVIIRGHVARANPLWQATDANVRAAVIFRGPSHYISPNWYPSKLEHGRAVPTFDYEVVEARGTVRFFYDEPALRAVVSDLTAEHERRVGESWNLDQAPESYIEAMLQAIVGFEVRVDELAGAYKLSQNRSQADRDSVAAALDALGTPEARAIAAGVRRAGSQ